MDLAAKAAAELRVYFGGIHDNVRKLLSDQIGKLNYRYKKTKDAAVKTEIDGLTAELERLPKRWMFGRTVIQACKRAFIRSRNPRA